MPGVSEDRSGGEIDKFLNPPPQAMAKSVQDSGLTCRGSSSVAEHLTLDMGVPGLISSYYRNL